jgi:PAS domain S-box-containing protein
MEAGGANAGEEKISDWLQSRRANFDEVVESVEDYAIVTLSPAGIVLDWNRGAERLKGYRPDQIVGRHFSRFYCAEDIERGLPQRELDAAAREGRFSEEGWRLRMDGSRIWASVTLTALREGSDGELAGFLKITRDLTERHARIEELRQSEERFRLMIESVTDYAIFMLDPGGHVASWNNGAKRIKGYTTEEILGRHFSVFYPAEAIAADLPATLLAAAREDGRVENAGWRVRKDGTRFWGQVTITALYDEGKVLRGFAKITRDLTLNRNIDQLRKAGRKKDTFLATLAHELRNPLAPVLTGLEVILKSPDDHGRITRVAAMLRRQVDQMSRLIEDLVDISRITSGKVVLRKDMVSLAEVMGRSIEAAKPGMEQKRQRLTYRLPPGEIRIFADLHRLSQAVTNLLSNAVRYTPPEGNIALSCSVDGQMLIVAVADDGIGIAPEDQEEIFDLFEQGANGETDGLGIGLTLVRTIARLHGGTVLVDSRGEGQGSTFTLRLPVVAAPGGTNPLPVGESEVRDQRKGRVVIADDNLDSAEMLSIFFNTEGMETAVAHDGFEAVEVSASFRPDLVCLDLGMPGMDGLEAARRIRSNNPSVFLVAISGWAGEEDRNRTKAAGFDVHLAKPATPADLREILRNCMSPA